MVLQVRLLTKARQVSWPSLGRPVDLVAHFFSRQFSRRMRVELQTSNLQVAGSNPASSVKPAVAQSGQSGSLHQQAMFHRFSR